MKRRVWIPIALSLTGTIAWASIAASNAAKSSRGGKCEPCDQACIERCLELCGPELCGPERAQACLDQCRHECEPAADGKCQPPAGCSLQDCAPPADGGPSRGAQR